ncbi:MAG TPA: hypothetical protein VMV45_12075 [Casimicrobiaceae bacterium]|nr:hypothetical protein [Casimicrobiaceae bacterium]
MDKDLAALEQRVSSLIAHTRALRAANESLRRDLAVAQQRQRDLTERMQQATDRVDSLLARIATE